MSAFRFVDLFAGLGGFHVALKRLGGKCVFAAEWLPHLRELYSLNHGVVPAGDITGVTPSDVPEHDVLTAGFPCQPFSKAGDQLGFGCSKQGQLFFNVEEILRQKLPAFFILENVPNLLRHNGGRTMEEISGKLRSIGYDIRATKLSPHQFGIPQIRERVYIVGSLLPLDSFQWPATSDAEISIEDILDENPADAKPLTSRTVSCLNVWNEFLKRCPADVGLPWYPLWTMEWGADYPYEETTPFAEYARGGKRALARMRGSHGQPLAAFREAEQRLAALPSHARLEQLAFPPWKQNFIRRNREFYRENRRWIDPWLNRLIPFPSSLQKLEWNVKDGERDIYDHVIQFRASGVRVKRRSSAPSLVAMTDTQVPIIGWQRRYMTVQECARLQSLDSLTALPTRPKQAFAALGNAVNADVVEKVARALFRGIGTAGGRELRNRLTAIRAEQPC